MKSLKINLLFLATLATLSSQSSFAALDLYTHANGATVVNINKADANGLSHNMYQKFNVPTQGMVINNSTTDLIRESGNISHNSNLDGPASLILNEVISKNPSYLNGYIEVAGQKADVIIANPNGISCSGCGFINTGRATLTTGTPTFSDGALTGFKVAQGSIAVSGDGLKGADYTDLLAQQINIRGQVETSQLNAIAGSYDYDIASGLVTAAENSVRYANSIDVSALGGVTAGIIQLKTTEAGAGVNNNGILNAVGLSITSDGALINNGTVESGFINAKTRSGIINNGQLSSHQTVLQTAGSFTNNGTIKATDSIDIISDGAVFNSSHGQIDAAGDIGIIAQAGNIDNAGKITSGKDLTMLTGFGPVGEEVKAKFNTSLLNSGSMQANNISLLAVNEINLLSGGDVTAQGAAYISAAKVSNDAALIGQSASVAAKEVRNSGVMQTTGLLSVEGKNGIYNTGSMEAGTLALITDEKISNSSCVWWVFCTKGTMKADKITITAPKIASLRELDGNYTTQTLELNKPVAPSEPGTSL